MLRALLAVSVALVPLCLPVRGGGSGALPRPVPAVAASHAAEGDEAPTEPVLTPPSYPRFLRPLPTDVPAPRPARRHGRELLLTFDDGPDLRGTAAVMAELDRRGFKGIFFVAGHRMIGTRREDLARRDLARTLATHGHMVANHTVNHRNLCREPETLAAEVDLNSDLITYATGVRPLLFRSPYGARCRKLDEALLARDLIQVGWNLDPQDWKGDTEDQITSYVTTRLARLTGPGILLLHDTHPQAVRALPRILDWIEEDNRRTARLGGEPLRVVDYAVLLPESPLPETGLEPLATQLLQSLPFGRTTLGVSAESRRLQ